MKLDIKKKQTVVFLIWAQVKIMMGKYFVLQIFGSKIFFLCGQF